MLNEFTIIAVTPNETGTRLSLKITLKDDGEGRWKVNTYLGNDGKEKFEVNGKIYTYLGGFRYE